jgi:ribose-phosphate pyrophosphokinase
VADLLETAGANRVMTMNLHSPQITGFFRIPVDHLVAGRLLCKYYMDSGIDNCVVVAPDAGSAKRAGHYAINLGLPLAILDKRRNDDSEHAVIHHVIGEVKGKRALIFDDEIATGGSILETVKALDNLGVKEIQACCVHAVLSGNAVELLKNSSLSKLVVTDTVIIPPEKKFPKMVVISVADMFAKAITYSHTGTSMSGLFGPV